MGYSATDCFSEGDGYNSFGIVVPGINSLIVKKMVSVTCNRIFIFIFIFIRLRKVIFGFKSKHWYKFLAKDWERNIEREHCSMG